jgi:D-alanyl-D-alanine carboxypeptidase
MALILQQAMKYDDFRTIAGTINYTIDKSDTLNNTLDLWNHAKILRKNTEYYYKYAEGSKTGFTQAALNTLVTYAKKDDVELICVILKDYGAASSYDDTTALFQWGFKQVKGITPLTKLKLKSLISSSEDIEDSKKESYMALKTSFNKDYYILVPDDFDEAKVSTVFEADEDKDEKILGYIVISSGETVIGRTPVKYEGSISSDPNKKVNGNEDGLETAPNNDKITPGKVFRFILKLFIAVILIIVIMGIIRVIIDRKTAKKDYGRRNKARKRARRRTTKKSTKK